jgi:hypothetical protein
VLFLFASGGNASAKNAPKKWQLPEGKKLGLRESKSIIEQSIMAVAVRERSVTTFLPALE